MSEKKLGFLIGDLFYTYTNYLNNALKEMDITISQARVLLVLAKNDGVSIDFLANKTNIGKSSITKSVKILEKKEKKEFLTKEIDPDDNRKKIIKITSKGKEIQKFAFKTNEEIENKLNLQIGEKEMADLKIKLEELIILIDS